MVDFLYGNRSSARGGGAARPIIYKTIFLMQCAPKTVIEINTIETAYSISIFVKARVKVHHYFPFSTVD